MYIFAAILAMMLMELMHLIMDVFSSLGSLLTTLTCPSSNFDRVTAESKHPNQKPAPAKLFIVPPSDSKVQTWSAKSSRKSILPLQLYMKVLFLLNVATFQISLHFPHYGLELVWVIQANQSLHWRMFFKNLVMNGALNDGRALLHLARLKTIK